MKIIVIGLGYYGKSVATRLSMVGHEVICIDNRMNNIDAVKDSVSAAFALDSTDMLALSSVPVKEADLCIVTIGEDLGASIRTIALLKKLGAKHIFARASDPVHRSIVEAFDVDRIITPEDDSAREFVAKLQLDTDAQVFNVANGMGVFRFSVPGCMVGKTIRESGLSSKFGLSVICRIRPDKTVNDIGISKVGFVAEPNSSEDTILEEGDVVVCYGSEKGFFKLSSIKDCDRYFVG